MTANLVINYGGRDEIVRAVKRLLEKGESDITEDALSSAMDHPEIPDPVLDGKEFDGGSADDYTLTIGSGSFIEGFEEGLIGKNLGEECDVEVTFPEEYHAK